MDNRLRQQQLFSLGFVLWNVLSSVGLIIINKWLMDVIRLNCILMLTSMHLFASWIPLYIMSLTGGLVVKPLRFIENAKLCASFFLTVAFFNLSLQYNTVGTYQLAKLVVTPATAFVQYFVDGTVVSKQVALSLFIITAAVAYATVMDVTIGAIGAAAAIIAVVASSINSIWTKNKPNELNLSPTELNYHLFPLTSLTFLIASLIFEKAPMQQLLRIVEIDRSSAAVGVPVSAMMLLTCVMASSLNNSSTKLIHYTSPITYHVVGHLKLIMILAFGVVFLSSPIDGKIFTGMVFAVGGVVYYTVLKQQEATAAAAAHTAKQ
eukprot:c12803_g1_i1.p1 GENE.c12803_g1_i1~~c12803_g1_i1.p1  ORF type:complete len:321 (+),score=71.82 c12803_g1_i1:131-1093(+)